MEMFLPRPSKVMVLWLLSVGVAQATDVPSVTLFDGTLDLTPHFLSQTISGQQAFGAVTATVQAVLTLSPLLLPAAVWAFLLGVMGVLGVKKRRQLRGASGC